jgi:hypothetical protein
MKKFERRIGARRTEGGSLGYVTILTIPKEVPSVPSEGPSRSTGRLSAALVAMGPARRQCSDHFGPCSRRAPSQMGFGSRPHRCVVGGSFRTRDYHFGDLYREKPSVHTKNLVGYDLRSEQPDMPPIDSPVRDPRIQSRCSARDSPSDGCECPSGRHDISAGD